jgi:hypothetical protein
MKYESALKTPEEKLPESCGHDGAVTHSYPALGLVFTLRTCPACHASFTAEFTVIATARPEHQRHAHAVTCRAHQLGLSNKTILRVLRALACISQGAKTDNDFVLEWPEWCWDNFRPSTGFAVAFPRDDVPPQMAEPGLGGRRTKVVA